jgi:hypothetical protein
LKRLRTGKTIVPSRFYLDSRLNRVEVIHGSAGGLKDFENSGHDPPTALSGSQFQAFGFALT